MKRAIGQSALPSSVARTAAAAEVASAWLELTKPRIASMVVFSAFVGALLGGSALWPAVEAAVWIGAVAAGSAVFNHWIERDTDRLMERTRGRPLVTGLVRSRDAILFGSALAVVGTLGLALSFNVLCALLSLTSLVLYCLVYTPLKRYSTLNTAVGAIPGAAPPLLGYVAATGVVDGWGVLLFALLYVWQFPHFMAIAWLHRVDYARADMKMLPALPEAAGLAGRQAVLYGIAMLPLVLVPAVQGAAGLFYVAGALALTLGYVAAAVGFGLRETRGRARLLLFASLVYLPLYFSTILLDPVVRATVAS